MNAVPPIQHGCDADIKDAQNLYRDFNERSKRDSEFVKLSANDKLMYYHRNASDVVKKFPIIFRYMCETGQFHPKAMKQYIDKLKNSPYKSEEEYCERNSDYIKYLYMATHSHYSLKEANQLWADAKQALTEELADFKKRLDDIKKENDDMKTVNAYERRVELKKHLDQMNQTKKD